MQVINDKYHDLSGYSEEFFKSDPFPYVVLKNFLRPDFFASLQEVFAKTDDTKKGKTFKSVAEEKKWISLNCSLPNATKMIIDDLNSEVWVKNLRTFIGDDSLAITDVGNTSLANFHVMSPGGVLGPHVDHSSEPNLGFPHVLNIIVCLSEKWDDTNGGATLLYNKDGSELVTRVPFEPNQAIVFLHTPYSFHGVERIASNSQNLRRTIYVDYYSRSLQPYINMNLKFERKWFRHVTTFKLNWTEYFKLRNKNYVKAMLGYQVNRLRSKLSRPI